MVKRKKSIETSLEEIMRDYSNGNKSKAFNKITGLRGRTISSYKKNNDSGSLFEIKRLESIQVGLFNRKPKRRF